ncbi:MAG: FAD-binding oxidoreductase [Pseudomonadota bacterium]
MQHLIDELKTIVGPSGWVDDVDALEPHLTEWRGTWRGRTALMVRPATTEQVAAVVRACRESSVAIVPQGGNTGLCGGAIPDESGRQILLSLSRMNAIRELSPDDYSMVAEAGCVLADLQTAAEKSDRLFPLSLAAEGSCQIGGNLSTNAGGTNVLRYGTARDQVLGLEVVLPDGEIISSLRTLRKDTAGYDLKQLFIGAEGTLGVITAASLKLFPRPENRQVAMLAVSSAQQAVNLFSELRGRLADQMQAYELMSALSLALVCEHIPDSRLPFDGEHPWYVLLDAAAPGGAAAAFEDVLMSTIGEGLVADAVIAKNEAEAQQFWRLRHSISEAQKLEGASLKHDVSVPVGEVARFIDAGQAAVERTVPGSRVVAFGHVGDGNVHFNVSQPIGSDAEGFLAERPRMAEAVYTIVSNFGGSISAEHGVGVLKREALLSHCSPAEIALMKTLKSTLDPGNLMNPGKVL